MTDLGQNVVHQENQAGAVPCRTARQLSCDYWCTTRIGPVSTLIFVLLMDNITWDFEMGVSRELYDDDELLQPTQEKIFSDTFKHGTTVFINPVYV